MREQIGYSFFPPPVVAFTTTRAVARDRQRLSALTGIAEQRVIMPHQVHGDRLLHITPTFLALPPAVQAEQLEGVDAVCTTLRGVCIGVSTADCVPVLLYDSHTQTIAAVHAGWRGTAQRLVQKVITSITAGDATHLRAVIGPSISCAHYEVGQEVYDTFLAAGFPMADIAVRGAQWHIDLARSNAYQLIESGVQAENIYLSPLCTYANPTLLFSARREQRGTTKCGRNFNAILLRE